MCLAFSMHGLLPFSPKASFAGRLVPLLPCGSARKLAAVSRFLQKVCSLARIFIPLPPAKAVTSAQQVSMAVVNSPYVGIAKGRLGEGVFSRVKGQTTVRGYNPSPANPRTTGQQSQRAIFSSAVKFFSRGVQNFFKFAFENKAEKESDYNAFMRYNSNRGVYFGPEQNDNPAYPALGRFIMTKGSLPAPEFFVDISNDVYARFAVSGAGAGAILTLGQLSDLLLRAGYLQGDIVTLCNITTDWIAGDESDPVLYGNQPPVWDIRQFTIDSTSAEQLSALGINAAHDGTDYILVSMEQASDNEAVCAGCVCVSRPSASGLKVSSSELWLNKMAERAWLYGRTATWRAKVLAAWKTSGTSILQGSRSVNKVAKEVIQWVAEPGLPTTVTQNQVLELYFARAMSLAEIAQHLKIVDEDGGEMPGHVSGGSIRWYYDSAAEAPLVGQLGATEPDVLTIKAINAGAGVLINDVVWE